MHATREPVVLFNYLFEIAHNITTIKLTMNTTTATETTLQKMSNLLQCTVPSLLAIQSLQAWDHKLLEIFYLQMNFSSCGH